jgi:hypothetical protein
MEGQSEARTERGTEAEFNERRDVIGLALNAFQKFCWCNRCSPLILVATIPFLSLFAVEFFSERQQSARFGRPFNSPKRLHPTSFTNVRLQKPSPPQNLHCRT